MKLNNKKYIYEYIYFIYSLILFSNIFFENYNSNASSWLKLYLLF